MTPHATHNEYVNCIISNSALARPGLSYSQAASGGGIPKFEITKTRLIGKIENSIFKTTTTLVTPTTSRTTQITQYGVLMSRRKDNSRDRHSRSHSRDLSSHEHTGDTVL